MKGRRSKTEIEIRDGRIARNGLGLPKTVFGNKAVLQRAENRVRASRGAFPYDRTLGSRIAAEAEREHPACFALAAAREALLQERGAAAVSAKAEGDAVTVCLAAGSESRKVELRTGGEA